MAGERGHFNPCEFRACVYLCGYGSVLIEAFHPDTSTFQLLKPRLADTHSACCLYAAADQLIVLCEEYTLLFEQGNNHQLREVGRSKHRQCTVGSNMPPLVDALNGYVYLADQGVCYAVQLDGSEVANLS